MLLTLRHDNLYVYKEGNNGGLTSFNIFFPELCVSMPKRKRCKLSKSADQKREMLSNLTTEELELELQRRRQEQAPLSQQPLSLFLQSAQVILHPDYYIDCASFTREFKIFCCENSHVFNAISPGNVSEILAKFNLTLQVGMRQSANGSKENKYGRWIVGCTLAFLESVHPKFKSSEKNNNDSIMTSAKNDEQKS